MQDFKNIAAWRRGHELTLAIYQATRTFPLEERFALVDQMRKAAVSIECNIAEGSSRGSDPEFRRFVFMALGSLAELECQAIISKDLKYVGPEAFTQLNSGIIKVRAAAWPLVETLTASIKEAQARQASPAPFASRASVKP